ALDRAAEDLFARHRLQIGGLDRQLAELLSSEYGISVIVDDGDVLGPSVKRRYRPEVGTLYVARWLLPGQRAFQLATQMALLVHSELISTIVATDDRLSSEARDVARIGLANYFAGALLLPYRMFLSAAEELRYDIDQLARRFEVGFETICHRLSTL
ncbi:ImmA/IrrE family metallo-endopeptidase, partial [Streptomyces doudnae]